MYIADISFVLEPSGIADEFVLQLIKMNSKQYRICTTGRNGPGGI
jgi:hypothetical protein